MMNRKMRIEQRAGLALIAANLVLGRFTAAPSFVLGFLLGLGVTLVLIGSLPNRAYSALKNRKSAISHRD
jgi:hypothetical protein